MTQMNLFMKQKQIYRHRDWTCGCKGGVRKGWIGSLGLADASHYMGLPWWSSGWESACQCWGHGFEPWSGKIPHAVEQLGPWATITEPAHVEPVLHNKRGHDSERPVHHDEEWPPLAATREKPSHRNEDPTQP